MGNVTSKIGVCVNGHSVVTSRRRVVVIKSKILFVRPSTWRQSQPTKIPMTVTTRLHWNVSLLDVIYKKNEVVYDSILFLVYYRMTHTNISYKGIIMLSIIHIHNNVRMKKKMALHYIAYLLLCDLERVVVVCIIIVQ